MHATLTIVETGPRLRNAWSTYNSWDSDRHPGQAGSLEDHLPAHLWLDETFVHVLTQQLAESLTILALLTLLLLLQLLPDLCLLLVQVPVTDQSV